jgi:ATP-dependent RNA helicase DHX29
VLHINHCLATELRTPRTPRINAAFQISTTDTRHLEAPTSSIQHNGAPDSVDHHTEKSRVLATYAPDSVTLGHSTSSDEEVDDPNFEYAKVKVKITELEAAKYQSSADNNSELAHLQTRLESLRTNYFFRLREADAHYNTERAMADRRALEQKLLGETDADLTVDPVVSTVRSSHTSKQKDHRPMHLSSTDHATGLARVDLFDDDSSPEASGGVFGTLLDTMPESEITDGVQVRIRDMSLPKHWAGRTPKALLLETVQKADRYAVISYRLLPDSRTSRAKRAAVVVRWEGAKTGEWSMDDVGCWDEGQAEQYISTVALHDVTFGHSEGFAGGGIGVLGGGGQTYFRLLPPVFRDLWDELELKRREAEDKRNREVWAVLRRIIEPKLGGDKKVRFNRTLKSCASSGLL